MQQHGNTIANIISGDGSKGQSSFFQNLGMFHIKLNGIHNVANILPEDTPPTDPWGWVQKVKFPFFFNYMAMLIIRLKKIMHAATW